MTVAIKVPLTVQRHPRHPEKVPQVPGTLYHISAREVVAKKPLEEEDRRRPTGVGDYRREIVLTKKSPYATSKNKDGFAPTYQGRLSTVNHVAQS
jgi:hypothetical protein